MQMRTTALHVRILSGTRKSPGRRDQSTCPWFGEPAKRKQRFHVGKIVGKFYLLSRRENGMLSFPLDDLGDPPPLLPRFQIAVALSLGLLRSLWGRGTPSIHIAVSRHKHQHQQDELKQLQGQTPKTTGCALAFLKRCRTGPKWMPSRHPPEKNAKIMPFGILAAWHPLPTASSRHRMP